MNIPIGRPPFIPKDVTPPYSYFELFVIGLLSGGNDFPVSNFINGLSAIADRKRGANTAIIGNTSPLDLFARFEPFAENQTYGDNFLNHLRYHDTIENKIRLNAIDAGQQWLEADQSLVEVCDSIRLNNLDDLATQYEAVAIKFGNLRHIASKLIGGGPPLSLCHQLLNPWWLGAVNGELAMAEVMGYIDEQRTALTAAIGVILGAGFSHGEFLSIPIQVPDVAIERTNLSIRMKFIDRVETVLGRLEIRMGKVNDKFIGRAIGIKQWRDRCPSKRLTVASKLLNLLDPRNAVAHEPGRMPTEAEMDLLDEVERSIATTTI